MPLYDFLGNKTAGSEYPCTLLAQRDTDLVDREGTFTNSPWLEQLVIFLTLADKVIEILACLASCTLEILT